MTNRVQTLRSSTPGQLPPAGQRQPGELWVNFPDQALGYIDPAQNPQKLLPVRFFSTTASYLTGDYVVQGGTLYRAKASVPAGAFNAANWDAVTTASGSANYLPLAGGTMAGGITLPGTEPSAAQNAATKAYVDTGVAKAPVFTLADTPPASPKPGDLWYDSVGGQTYVWFNDGSSSQWVIVVNQNALAPAYATVSDTAPPGPTNGQFWFNSADSQLYMFYVDPSGPPGQWVVAVNQAGAYANTAYVDAATAPVKAATGSFFSAYMSANQTGIGGTYVILNYDTVEFDSNNEFNPSTHIFTAKRAGYYRVNASTPMGNVAGTPSNMIYKNGTQYLSGTWGTALVAGGNSLNMVDALVHLNAGDTLAVYGNGPTNTIAYGGAFGGSPAGTFNRFQVQLLALG